MFKQKIICSVSLIVLMAGQTVMPANVEQPQTASKKQKLVEFVKRNVKPIIVGAGIVAITAIPVAFSIWARRRLTPEKAIKAWANDNEASALPYNFSHAPYPVQRELYNLRGKGKVELKTLTPETRQFIREFNLKAIEYAETNDNADLQQIPWYRPLRRMAAQARLIAGVKITRSVFARDADNTTVCIG